MISFAALESRVRTLFEAESTTRWVSSAFLEAANEGLDELSEATAFYERKTPIPMKGKQTYYDLRGFLPRDVVSINSIWNTSQQFWLDPAGIDDLLFPKWNRVVGEPERYIMRGAYWLGVYPRPGADTNYPLMLYYSGHAPHFKDSDSVLSDLPDDIVPALEFYMLYDLSIRDGESKKAMLHWADYRKRETMLADFIKDRITTSRTGRMGRGRAV